MHDLVGREHAAVGLHHVERHPPVAGVRGQPPLDVGDVRREPRLDRRVDEGGHRAFVLAVLAQHLARQRHHGLGVLLGEHRPHPLLVLRVGVGVQEADAQGGDALRLEPARDRAGTVLVEGPHLGAGEVEPAADALDQVTRDDPGRLHPEVRVAVAVGHRLAGDLEHRLVALGGDVAQGVDLALEQLVRGDRGAVADRADRVAVTLRKAQQPEHLVDAGHEPVGRVARRRGRLGGDEHAGVLVEGDDVGEGAAGVDADADPARHAASLVLRLWRGDGNTCPLFYPRVVDLSVVVRGTDPPGRTFASYGDVHVGVQVGREAVGLVPADTPAPEWALDVAGTTGTSAARPSTARRATGSCTCAGSTGVGGLVPRVPPRQADARPDRPGRGRVGRRGWTRRWSPRCR